MEIHKVEKIVGPNPTIDTNKFSPGEAQSGRVHGKQSNTLYMGVRQLVAG